MSDADRLESLGALRVSEDPAKIVHRGRWLFILCFVIFLLGKCLEMIAWLAEGDPIQLLVTTVTTGVFVLLFFAGWIGQHWARWVLAAMSLMMGLYGFVWGCIRLFFGGESGGGLLLLGGIYLAMTLILTVSASVHLFARHQQGTINKQEMATIGGVLLLCLSVPAGCLVVAQGTRWRLENESRAFAAEAFQQIFVEKDPDYLLGHASDGMRENATLWKFRQAAASIAKLGKVTGDLKLAPADTDFRKEDGKFEFNASYVAHGKFQEKWTALDLQVVRQDGQFQISGVQWNQPPPE